MPDQRKHRGPHPEDCRLFAAEQVPGLRSATRELSWLLTRGYAATSALKLVGDRHALDARQRLAVARCACADQQRAGRKQRQMNTRDLQGCELWIDGFNVLTSVEAALSDGVILHARDGCYRDMASMHGSYRKVEESIPAVEILAELFRRWQVAAVYWVLDQPVSNSGRLKTMLRQLADQRQGTWHVQLLPNPDAVLADVGQIVASADGQVLDQANRWFNLAREAIGLRVPGAWVVDLSG